MSERALKPGSVLLLDVLENASARFFDTPEDIISCTSLDAVSSSLEKLEQAQASGYHAAGFLSYELGYAFEEKLQQKFKEAADPLMWFGLYRTYDELTTEQAKELLRTNIDARGDLLVSEPQFDMASDEYEAVFNRAKEHLAKGDIYQVNLTMRAAFTHKGSPEQFFLDLLHRQPVEYAAFLRLADRAVLSISPELFLERQGDILTTRPMKGTAPRGRYLSEDRRIARELATDTKQRSENTMIVDLMRNDLSRIAKTGSVRVSSLCEVERYRSLHQMTSTVEGELEEGIGFEQIIKNLFPCGSITGAPKLNAMLIADELEHGPRGVYTGSIGCLEPSGDFRFNVAIRTLVLKNDGRGEVGAGSGVVFDSGATSEYEECALKLKFLSQEVPVIDLIETMAFHPGEGFYLLERHLNRLQLSANYFGFKIDLDHIRSTLNEKAKLYDCAKRVRLLLSENGEVSISETDLGSINSAVEFQLTIADERMSSRNRFLFHKTTNRGYYDDTRKKYQAATGCDEVLFLNENGYLTEGSYTTLFIRKGRELLTPALKHGLLPGTLRAGFLERGIASEADLVPSDLKKADQIFVGNSVRGLIKACLISPQVSK